MLYPLYMYNALPIYMYNTLPIYMYNTHLLYMYNTRSLYKWDWSGQTKHYNIGIYRISANHTALRSKSKDWLTLNQNNVSE